MHRMSMRTWRLPLAVVTVAATILLAGGLAVGSNMGFKMNQPLVLAGNGPIGNNWVSIPYNNPYVTIGGFCSQTGLPSVGGASPNSASIQFRKADGTFDAPVACSAVVPAGGPAFSSLPPGASLQIRVPNIVGNPTSIIIVGSHNPTLSVTLPATGNGQLGNFWLSPPYHTTAVTLNDLCIQAGIPSTAPGPAVAQLLNPTSGATTAVSCPGPNAANENLELGRGYQLRYGGAPLSFIPAHF